MGIGINFHISTFPEAIAHKAGSLFTETPTITRSELVAKIWSEFHQLSKRDFFEIYKTHSFILGKTVEFEENKVLYRGTAVDLTPSGQLIVHLEDGQIKTLSSGEISLKTGRDGRPVLIFIYIIRSLGNSELLFLKI